MSIREFFLLSELDLPVKIKITALEGRTVMDRLMHYAYSPDDFTNAEPMMEMFITAQIFANGTPLGLPVSTGYHTFPLHTGATEFRFNEWLTFPIRYRELAPGACLAFTVWRLAKARAGSQSPYAPAHSRSNQNPGQKLGEKKERKLSDKQLLKPRSSRSVSYHQPDLNSLTRVDSDNEKEDVDEKEDEDEDEEDEDEGAPVATPIGGSTIPLFSTNGTLKLGSRRLYLWLGRTPDGDRNSTTPHIAPHQIFMQKLLEPPMLYDPRVSEPPSVQRAKLLEAVLPTVKKDSSQSSLRDTEESNNDDPKITPAMVASALSVSANAPVEPSVLAGVVSAIRSAASSRLTLDQIEKALRKIYFEQNNQSRPNTDAGTFALNLLSARHIERTVFEHRVRALADQTTPIPGLAELASRTKLIPKLPPALVRQQQRQEDLIRRHKERVETLAKKKGLSPDDPSVQYEANEELLAEFDELEISAETWQELEDDDVTLVIDHPPFRHPVVYHYPDPYFPYTVYTSASDVSGTSSSSSASTSATNPIGMEAKLSSSTIPLGAGRLVPHLPDSTILASASASLAASAAAATYVNLISPTNQGRGTQPQHPGQSASGGSSGTPSGAPSSPSGNMPTVLTTVQPLARFVAAVAAGWDSGRLLPAFDPASCATSADPIVVKTDRLLAALDPALSHEHATSTKTLLMGGVESGDSDAEAIDAIITNTDESVIPIPHTKFHTRAFGLRPALNAAFDLAVDGAMDDSLDPEESLQRANLKKQRIEECVEVIGLGLANTLRDRPTPEDRAQLAEAISQPPLNKLTDEQRMRFIRFGHSLIHDPRALPRYLRAIDWSKGENSPEAANAVRLAWRWTPCEPEVAIELLLPYFTQLPSIRALGVTRLAAAPTSQLAAYALQLVQALRYESQYPSALSELLISRACTDANLATELFWYGIVEAADPKRGALYSRFVADVGNELQHKRPAWHHMLSRQVWLVDRLTALTKAVTAVRGTPARVRELRSLVSPTGAFKDLLQFSPVRLPIDPNIRVTGIIAENSSVFKSAKAPVLLCFTLATEEEIKQDDAAEDTEDDLANLTNRLTDLRAPVEAPSGGMTSPVGSPTPSAAQGQATEAKGDDVPEEDEMTRAETVNAAAASSPMPIGASSNSQTKAGGSQSKKALVTASKHCGRQAIVPGGTYRLIFKAGDDLRQDQLVIQMFNLIDSLLKEVRLDLELTPYRVLATSQQSGFVEFVANADTIQDILQTRDRDLKKYLAYYNPDPENMTKALDNFIRSSAGYCICTYLFGVGDRHLENILLTHDGHLFHIDFGFIFGRDPKPYALPPMKILRQMVDVMGGEDSEGYLKFRRYCCLCFNILRKHAGLILNLLGLMVDAGINDFAGDGEKNLLKVQEKFKLELSDEEAEHYILEVVDVSLAALLSVLNDRVHAIAVTFKS